MMWQTTMKLTNAATWRILLSGIHLTFAHLYFSTFSLILWIYDWIPSHRSTELKNLECTLNVWLDESSVDLVKKFKIGRLTHWYSLYDLEKDGSVFYGNRLYLFLSEMHTAKRSLWTDTQFPFCKGKENVKI